MELRQLLVELLAGVHVLLRGLEAESSPAQAATCDVDSPAVQGLHCDLEAVSLLADQVCGRDSHVVETHQSCGLDGPTHLFLLLAVLNSLCVTWDDEGRDVGFRGLGHDDVETAEAASRDEHLGSIEDIISSILLSKGLHCPRIRPAIWFGQAVAREILHADQPCQMFFLLRLAAELIDDPGAHIMDG